MPKNEKQLNDAPADELFPLTREKLYELAWSQPMLSIAKKYGVSSSYLARVYTRMNVPRPAPGYWTKVEVGKPVIQPPLPEARPEDELEWDRNNDSPPRPKAKPHAPRNQPRKMTKRGKRPVTHKMLSGAKVHFLKTRTPRNGYLRPYKWILVDLIISEKGLDRALKLANQIFWAFEDYGYRVTYSPPKEYSNRPRIDEREEPKNDRDIHYDHDRHWGPSRATIVYIGDVAFGITLIELSKSVEVRYQDGEWVPVSELKTRKRSRYDRPWSTTHHKDRPSGKFCLQAYSAYGGTNWIKRWTLPLDNNATRIGHKIAKELHAACPEVLAQIQQERIRREKQHAEYEEWEYRHEQERLEKLWGKANTASRDQLDKIISDWSESKRIEAFFHQVEQSTQNLPAGQRQHISERVETIMQYVGRLDPLTELTNWQSPTEIMESIGEPLPDSAAPDEEPA